jgi:hypothetical protein
MQLNQVKNITAGIAVMFSPSYFTAGSFDNTNEASSGLSSIEASPAKCRASWLLAFKIGNKPLGCYRGNFCLSIQHNGVNFVIVFQILRLLLKYIETKY